MPGLDTQETFVAGRDLVSTAWRDLQSFCCRDLLPLPGPDLQGVSVAGIVLQWFQLPGRKFLLQGFASTASGSAGSFCRRDCASPALGWICRIFCCSDLVSTVRPDLQEVSVARIWFELPAPDLQDVFVAGILFQLAGLHQLVDLRNQELKGYTACAQIL